MQYFSITDQQLKQFAKMALSQDSNASNRFLFVFTYAFLHSFLGSLVTYTVILTQLEPFLTIKIK